MRVWYRQKKPYDLPLPFTFTSQYISSASDSSSLDGRYFPPYYSLSVGPASFYPAVMAEARERLVKKIRATASEIAVTMAERRQAVNMIVKRFSQLTSFVKALKRLRFGDAFDALDVRRPRANDPFWHKLKQHGKDLGGLFLEFHFGWEPLVKDIGNAIETLQKGVPPVWVKTRSQGSGSGSFSPYDFATHSYSWTIKATCNCQVSVTNPNLFLANQMGFVNPLGIIWELIPFSFVVDWFVTVGDFLNSFTEFWGLTIVNASNTYYAVIPQSNRYFNPGHTYLNSGDDILRTFTGTSVTVVRTPGLPSGPDLRIRPFEKVSVTRAVTAVSLLLQQLARA